MRKLNLFAVILCAYLVLRSTHSVNTTLDDWETFKQRHGKSFSTSANETLRHMQFEARGAKISQHNQEAANGLHNYTMGLNEYSDLTEEEFARMNGYRPGNNSNGHGRPFIGTKAALPTSIDWRTRGYVTGVKNQGQCGSCWAFSATGALEGQRKRTTGSLVPLSEQQLLDCDTYDGACNGGWPSNAFVYVGRNRGIDTAACYPYRASKGARCLYSTGCIGATCSSSYTSISSGNEALLAQAVATVGPVSVAIHVTSNFQNYRSGTFYDTSCSTSGLNHAVLVVGYTPTYWIVKNSWGTSWGMSGYIYMSRNRGNNCGIASAATYPNGVASG